MRMTNNSSLFNVFLFGIGAIVVVVDHHWLSGRWWRRSRTASAMRSCSVQTELGLQIGRLTMAIERYGGNDDSLALDDGPAVRATEPGRR
jgi:hypothetical protein